MTRWTQHRTEVASVKSLIKKLARLLGYDIVRHAEAPERPIDVLSLVVETRLPNRPHFNFVQIGANDGISGDPIRHIVRRHRLPGVFVEPLPDLFEQLRGNYADLDSVHYERCAIGEQDGESTLYRVRPDPALPAWLQGLASFNRDHITSARFGVTGVEKYVEDVRVPVLTLPSLLRKHGIGELGLLQVDVEGYDCRLVQAALKAGVRPAIINYEHIHAQPTEQAACKHALAEAGYRFVDVGRDTLAVLDA
jgi:FkbM family methyltransferase